MKHVAVALFIVCVMALFIIVVFAGAQPGLC